MNALKPLVVFLLLVGGLLYLGGIAWAGVASLGASGPTQLPEALTYAITTIGGVLATNFGAIFGISLLPENGERARSLKMSLRETAGKKVDTMQVIAAYVYVVSLVVALVFWALDGLSSDSAAVLRNLTLTLIGVIGGILAVALNVKNT